MHCSMEFSIIVFKVEAPSCRNINLKYIPSPPSSGPMTTIEDKIYQRLY